MAKSPIAMPNTMVVLDKNGLGAQCVKDETEDTMNRKQFSRQSTGCRASNSDLDLPRRTPTPSKQVSLPSVRRKEEQVACSGDGTAASSFDTFARPGGFYSDVQALSSKLNLPSSPTKSDSNGPESKLPYTQNQGALTDAEENEREENVENESEGSSEDERSTAPSQLLMEFLGCVMEEDFENAEKLCKMILLYEPENPEALKFKPLIEEKLRQEELSDGDSSDDDDDDDSSDDNEGGDDDDSSSEESDESSEENSADT